MKLDFIPLGQQTISKANMRYAARVPDVSDILPTVRRRGVIVPVLVRPVAVSCDAGAPAFEIVAGARRFFDVEASGLAIVADLFGEERYFADAQGFWAAQDAALAAKREAYLEEGWADVVIVPRGDYFHLWEYSKAPKRKGGRVYVDVQGNGEVVFHEGYVTTKEARRLEKGEEPHALRQPWPRRRTG